MPPARASLSRVIRLSPRRVLAVLLVVLLLPVLGACAKGFQPRKFATTDELYRATLDRIQRKKWDDALAGLDLLASQLPARDTLLARVYLRQGEVHSRRGEHLLAAQAYGRIQEAFPDDPSADRALFEQAREYQKLWRKPRLDVQYGQTALNTFRQLASAYPDSPLVPEAARQIDLLNAWFAVKDYDTGMHYFRRKAWDSAVIYFKDVVRTYPGTPAAKRSYVRMVEAYQAINYREDVAETCANARQAFPKDVDVTRVCGAAPATAVGAGPTPQP